MLFYFWLIATRGRRARHCSRMNIQRRGRLRHVNLPRCGNCRRALPRDCLSEGLPPSFAKRVVHGESDDCWKVVKGLSSIFTVLTDSTRSRGYPDHRAVRLQSNDCTLTFIVNLSIFLSACLEIEIQSFTLRTNRLFLSTFSLECKSERSSRPKTVILVAQLVHQSIHLRYFRDSQTRVPFRYLFERGGGGQKEKRAVSLFFSPSLGALIYKSDRDRGDSRGLSGYNLAVVRFYAPSPQSTT